MMLNEVGLLHNSSLSLQMYPDGDGGSGNLVVIALAGRKGEVKEGLPKVISLRKVIAAHQPGLMANQVYQLLMKLDAECTRQWWRNERLC